jgi:hypothetical protein
MLKKTEFFAPFDSAQGDCLPERSRRVVAQKKEKLKY